MRRQRIALFVRLRPVQVAVTPLFIPTLGIQLPFPGGCCRGTFVPGWDAVLRPLFQKDEIMKSHTLTNGRRIRLAAVALAAFALAGCSQEVLDFRNADLGTRIAALKPPILNSEFRIPSSEIRVLSCPLTSGRN